MSQVIWKNPMSSHVFGKPPLGRTSPRCIPSRGGRESQRTLREQMTKTLQASSSSICDITTVRTLRRRCWVCYIYNLGQFGAILTFQTCCMSLKSAFCFSLPCARLLGSQATGVTVTTSGSAFQGPPKISKQNAWNFQWRIASHDIQYIHCNLKSSSIFIDMSTIEIYKQSKVTRSPTMCRMNTCKPSVSKGRSCNTLVQRLSRPCTWYLSVATLAPRSRSTIHKRRPKCHMAPQMWTQTKGISTKLVFPKFFPTWESAHIYFWWIMKHQMNQSSANNQGFWKMVEMAIFSPKQRWLAKVPSGKTCLLHGYTFLLSCNCFCATQPASNDWSESHIFKPFTKHLRTACEIIVSLARNPVIVEFCKRNGNHSFDNDYASNFQSVVKDAQRHHGVRQVVKHSWKIHNVENFLHLLHFKLVEAARNNSHRQLIRIWNILSEQGVLHCFFNRHNVAGPKGSKRIGSRSRPRTYVKNCCAWKSFYRQTVSNNPCNYIFKPLVTHVIRHFEFVIPFSKPNVMPPKPLHGISLLPLGTLISFNFKVAIVLVFETGKFSFEISKRQTASQLFWQEPVCSQSHNFVFNLLVQGRRSVSSIGLWVCEGSLCGRHFQFATRSVREFGTACQTIMILQESPHHMRLELVAIPTATILNETQ